MSSRLKKCKGSARKKSKWVSWEEFRQQVRQGELAAPVQSSSCRQTGEVFVRPITGRFKSLPEERLRRMVEDLQQVFIRAGHPPVLGGNQPLWAQAEFLDNMLDFELNPPCGCASELSGVIKSA